MAISDDAAREVTHVLRKHLDDRFALEILQDLRRVDGGDSFNETVRMVIDLLVQGME